jgi:hypothetical protein
MRKSIKDTGEDFTREVRDLDAGLRAWKAPSPDAKEDTQDQASGTDAGDG